MKIALVHDYLVRFGGAERVLFSIHKIFPRAPIFTLVWDERKMRQYFPDAKIKPSFLNKFPKFLSLNPRRLAFLLPMAVESIDFSDYDMVISSSSAFVKGIVTRTNTVHICHCHAPSRFMWEWSHNYLKDRRFNRFSRPFASFFLNYLRIWDVNAAQRVDHFLANSNFTASRIHKYYRKDSTVLYPPVRRSEIAIGGDNPLGDKKFFIIVSQLANAKRIDLAINAFKKLEIPLVIIGEGPEKRRLEKAAGKETIFLGRLSDQEVDKYLAHAQGFIFPGEDDFGIAPVEAMMHGKPVLALRKGGATETVIEGVTGEFFDSLDVETIADGVRRMRKNISEGKYDPRTIKNHAEKFSEEQFKLGLLDFLKELEITNARQ